jgi:hypothetical protein
MAREEFSGGGRLWIDGTLVAIATSIDVTIGGNSSRIVTTGGLTGEVTSDPTMMKVSVQGAIPKTGTSVRTVSRKRETKTDITLKVQIGNNVRTGRGKITSEKLSGAPGKGEFSFDFEGDAQSVG